MEIIVNKKNKEVKILERQANKLLVVVDNKKYHVDAKKIDKNTYSLLYKGKSYDLKVVSEGDMRKYSIKHKFNHYKVEIMDSVARYRKNRGNNDIKEDQSSISSPMPGKVVKIPIEVGDNVKSGQTLIIISAMKMESEYKAKKDGKIKEILTTEGSTIEGNQSLILIE
ncbi:MAG: acetyl-CoA carboxylase biotin carboxyl carrier protein subunit [Bacteroidales bacterium]|nr:acetyl-CoA carboxylase biotin carboxyl carrier protein subunit [Bacteroidales bacterium]